MAEDAERERLDAAQAEHLRQVRASFAELDRYMVGYNARFHGPGWSVLIGAGVVFAFGLFIIFLLE